ncbi:MAG TPA: metallophosphoesterase [Gemmatimonadaceae bacterium]|nr:metallophosphoesterase [Gemmatimonadaceae bacterium]
MPLLVLAVLLVACGVLLYATVVAPRRLRMTSVTAPIAQLPPELDGYTIAMLSDIHHGCAPWTGRWQMRRALAMVQGAQPDLVALLGDYGISVKSWRGLGRWMYPRAMAALTPALRSLRACDGVVAVLGNHDHFYDAARVTAWLADAGATVLVNDHTCIRRGGALLVCAGLDDAKEGVIDPAAGCACAPPDAPRIVLSHNPDGVLHLAPDERVDLVLAGHTHGGQVVIPRFGAPMRLSRVCTPRAACGWIPNDRAPLYVSAGIGTVIPLRINCAPEVVIVRLVSAAGETLPRDPNAMHRA